MLSIVRTPLSTRLLKGHDTKDRFGSSATTSMAGSSARTYFAAVAPPQPPPVTTTRRDASGMKSPFVEAAHPPSATTAAPAPATPRNVRRVIRSEGGCAPLPNLPPTAGCAGGAGARSAGASGRVTAGVSIVAGGRERPVRLGG